jgi:hypothetical protein
MHSTFSAGRSKTSAGVASRFYAPIVRIVAFVVRPRPRRIDHDLEPVLEVRTPGELVPQHSFGHGRAAERSELGLD